MDFFKLTLKDQDLNYCLEHNLIIFHTAHPELLGKSYPQIKEEWANECSGYLWNLPSKNLNINILSVFFAMRKGDLVAITNETEQTIFGIARIIGEYAYQNNMHTHKVEWVSTTETPTLDFYVREFFLDVARTFYKLNINYVKSTWVAKMLETDKMFVKNHFVALSPEGFLIHEDPCADEKEILQAVGAWQQKYQIEDAMLSLVMIEERDFLHQKVDSFSYDSIKSKEKLTA